MTKNAIRLYTEVPLHSGATFDLSDAQVNYLRNVMRVNVSEHVRVFNGADGEWLAVVESLSKNSGFIRAQNQTRPQTPEPDVWLVFAPIKFGKIDYLVQKAAELGASALVPVITQHTIAGRVNTERLQANALEGAEQCERLSAPKVHEPQKFEQLLAHWDSERKLMLCDESGQGVSVAEALKHHTGGKWAILIGPEGGFSKSELTKLHSLPYVVPVGLGPRILRADTAALAALACWQMILGDWHNAPRFEAES